MFIQCIITQNLHVITKIIKQHAFYNDKLLNVHTLQLRTHVNTVRVKRKVTYCNVITTTIRYIVK